MLLMTIIGWKIAATERGSSYVGLDKIISKKVHKEVLSTSQFSIFLNSIFLLLDLVASLRHCHPPTYLQLHDGIDIISWAFGAPGLWFQTTPIDSGSLGSVKRRNQWFG
jgi:hypothetical protein